MGRPKLADRVARLEVDRTAIREELIALSRITLRAPKRLTLLESDVQAMRIQLGEIQRDIRTLTDLALRLLNESRAR